VTPSKNAVASILARLGNEARHQVVPVNQLLQFYAIERLLARLSRTPHVNGVLLKGALLLKTIDIPRARPTMDIDLLRQGKADRESLITIVRDSATVEDESDGVTFDAESIVAEDISKDAEYRDRSRVRIRQAGDPWWMSLNS
jgi:nucleotidyltransferase AbiEii toxin of type IV toxin-antitoxin system